MAISLIALDLDGTTLFDHNTLSERNRRALETAAARGVHIVVASGRCFDSLPACILQLPMIQYAITSNGAAIYEVPKRCIKRFSVPEGSIESVLRLAREFGAALEIFWQGGAYSSADFLRDPSGYALSEASIRYLQTTRNPVLDIEAFIQEHRTELDSIDLRTARPADFEPLCERIRSEVPELYLTSSVPGCIELSSPAAGKHNGLAFLLDRLGLDAANAAAFGDADNDMEMLAYAGYGLAVENATERCRAAASRVVPSNKEDGVAVGIEWLLGL